MTSPKKSKLNETTEKVGKAVARSTFKAESAGRVAHKKAEKLATTVSKQAQGAMERVSIFNGAGNAAEDKTTPLPFKAGPGLTIPEQFGLIAGDIYHYLGEKGLTPTSRVVGAMLQRQQSQANVLAAMGWLAREDKIEFSSDGNMVALKE